MIEARHRRFGECRAERRSDKGLFGFGSGIDLEPPEWGPELIQSSFSKFYLVKKLISS